MKNIIEFKINGSFVVEHNGITVDTSTRLVVECVKGKNILTITGDNISVESVKMYGLGENALASLAEVEDSKWTLEYEYPVFPWLHKILNHGWLLKEDNE